MDSVVGLFELSVYWIGLTFGVAFFGSVASAGNRNQYDALDRPAWSPPPFLFGIVWTFLYTFEGLAAARIRELGAFEAGVNQGALVLFLVLQAVLALYTPSFALLRSSALATLVIFIALVLAVIVAILFVQLDVFAGVVMFVLVAWLVFALILSSAIWIRNSGKRAVESAFRSDYADEGGLSNPRRPQRRRSSRRR